MIRQVFLSTKQTFQEICTAVQNISLCRWTIFELIEYLMSFFWSRQKLRSAKQLRKYLKMNEIFIEQKGWEY